MINRRRWGMRRTTRRQLVAGVLVATAPIAAGAAWPTRYIDRLYPGTAVLGTNLGGLTRAEAASRIDAGLAAYLQRPVTFRFAEQTWPASAAELGISIDLAATLDRACAHGRGHGWLRRYATLLDQEDAGANVPVIVHVDEPALHEFVSGIAAEISAPPRAARLAMEDGTAVIIPEVAGLEVDTGAMRADVLAGVTRLTPTEIDVPTKATTATTTAERLAPVRAEVAGIVGAPVAVVYGDRRWTVEPDHLADALVLPDDPTRDRPSLDPEILAPLLSPIADEIDHPPLDATVAWGDGLYATSEGYAGAAVDVAALSAAVAEAATGETREVELPITYLPAAVDAANLEALGITQPLATGSSSFAGSSEERATNVRVAAEHVSQALLPPGGVLSFNDALGPITADQGYVEGKVISGDWFADDLGGGVCQVSTTVFRAALNAGLPFAEWHPHTFRLGFYELEGWPPGMDAAIYQPNTPDEWELDLLIVNPTDAWILLQMRVADDEVVAELYGPETGFEVRLSEPTVGDPIPPPEPVERPSTELAPGQREQAQEAQPGVEVKVTREVSVDGTLVLEDTFVSPYAPQPDVWLVGE